MHMPFDAAGAAWFVLDISLRPLAAAATVAIVLRLLHVRAAAVLHSAWTAVLLTMLSMPILPFVVPALPIPVAVRAGTVFDAISVIEPSPPLVAVSPTPGPDATAESPRIAAAVRPSDRLTARAQAAQPWLVRLLPGIYAAGFLLCVARLLYGWSLASAMIRRARRDGPLRLDVAALVYQSAEIAVPMTVGAMRPVIVLPVAWRSWDADTRAAIIAHELAHLRRRDASVNLAAQFNRALFWFHPLAWWLERKLAVTAEHVCDEAAARAIAAPARYAEMLVEMADIVRRKRGRLGWQAVGMSGAGLLDRRIDRLLYGDAFAGDSRRKTIAAAVACTLVIATAAACRPQGSSAPLRQDPELAARLTAQNERTARFEAARDMTQEQADLLEQRLAVNPDDFEARRQLVTYYSTSSNVAWDKKVPGLRRHALWLIEHHPEHEIQAPPLSPRYDAEGFAAAKLLWNTHLARRDASPYLVYRSASFFAPHDKPYAEQLIRRGLAMDPDSSALKARMPPDVGGYEWRQQLASLYAAALRGSERTAGTYNDIRTHLDQIHSAYAEEVRSRLEATTDAQLLARVGGLLSRSRSTGDAALQQALGEIRALGIRYLERALEIDPTLTSAKAILVRIRMPEQVSDVDRLAARALEGYMVAEDITEYARKDAVAGKRQRDQAAALAEDVLKMAAAHSYDAAYSAAVMTAHHVLALAALRDGDRERAVQHMRASVNVPPSEEIQYALSFSWGRPVNRLLREGEREGVVEFLEALARLTITDRGRLLRDAQAIREGRMPASYQLTVAREGQ
jgi:hypothetical protein